MSDKLKPCPFCQGTNLKVVNGNWIKCENIHCGARGPMQVDNKSEAIAAWNRRQEAKPLTESELTRIICNATGWEPLSEEVLLRTVKAIHAALPPDRPSREAVEAILNRYHEFHATKNKKATDDIMALFGRKV